MKIRLAMMAAVLVVGSAVASAPEPVAGTLIALERVPGGTVVHSAVSDAQGLVSFSSVQAGVYDVAIASVPAHDNFDTRSARVTIHVGELAPTSSRAGLPVKSQRLRIEVPAGGAPITVLTQIE